MRKAKSLGRLQKNIVLFNVHIFLSRVTTFSVGFKTNTEHKTFYLIVSLEKYATKTLNLTKP